MHIAAAVGTPVLGIFGPTRPELQGPYGEANRTVRNESLGCLGCNLTSCPIGNPCMNDLSVDTVFTAFEELQRSNPERPSIYDHVTDSHPRV
jgi:ADP-heptose:LPS heptosyltransferase